MIIKSGHQGDIIFIKVDQRLVAEGSATPPFGTEPIIADLNEAANQRHVGTEPIVLALGEVTGHQHVIADVTPLMSAVLFGDIAELNVNHPKMFAPSDTRLRSVLNLVEVGSTFSSDQLIGQLVVGEEPVVVTHDEHDPVTLDVGVWIVARQKQWSALDSNFRAVAD